MDDNDKLKAMLYHWLEHNGEHADTYVKWAEKPSVAAVDGLAGLLNEIAAETMKINGLFKKAINVLESTGKP
ncbi:MAG: hypothetical protein HQL01_02380 [Nitrospirae bacterium]|nr:hypothetical protein [Nitrospirota bacterium]